jgi:acetyl/propionyl-CoA carboxylase alpha subunit
MARGHATECRVYAEDPENGDLPSAGRILHLAWPAAPGVRVDAGVDAGSEVTVDYDPLLAKIVTLGHDRAESLDRMAAALARTVVLGIETNLPRLQRIVAHPDFLAGRFDTGFLARHEGALRWPAVPPPEAIAAAAATAGRARASRVDTEAGAQAPDAWSSLGSWRLA